MAGFLNNRHYLAGYGTFASVDPIAIVYQPATLNPYVYAQANPIAMSDPSGLCASADACERWASNCSAGGDIWHGPTRSCNSYTVAQPVSQAAVDAFRADIEDDGIRYGAYSADDTAELREILADPGLSAWLLESHILPVPETFIDPCTGPLGDGVVPCATGERHGYDYGAIAHEWMETDVIPAMQITVGVASFWGLVGYFDNQGNYVVGPSRRMADADDIDVNQLRMSQTVQNHASNRPYVDSPLTLRQIIEHGTPRPDPGGLPRGPRWDVPGVNNGRSGTWEVVIDTETNTVVHYMFRGGG